MIDLENVTKSYRDGFKGLSDFTLKVPQGEFISIIGRSGAGKSTLLRLINGSILPTEGTVHVLNHHLNSKTSEKELRLVRRETGFIFQQHNLIKTHTVLSNVLMGRLGYMGPFSSFFGLFSTEDKEKAAAILKEVGLEDKIHTRVDELSGGQQQRVAIARALLQEPKIILADEPMASLDPKLSEVVLDLLHKFNQERKITVLVNVHVLDLARRRATRIIGLKKGKLVFNGKPSELNDSSVSEIYES